MFEGAFLQATSIRISVRTSCGRPWTIVPGTTVRRKRLGRVPSVTVRQVTSRGILLCVCVRIRVPSGLGSLGTVGLTRKTSVSVSEEVGVGLARRLIASVSRGRPLTLLVRIPLCLRGRVASAGVSKILVETPPVGQM